jgi:hypothetical protein
MAVYTASGEREIAAIRVLEKNGSTDPLITGAQVHVEKRLRPQDVYW